MTMTDDEVWALVVQYTPGLRAACLKFLPKDRRNDLDTMFSDVVIDRALSIMATWRPEKGASKAGHLFANVRWYAFKWVDGSHYRKHVKTEVLRDDDAAYVVDHDLLLQVYSVLDSLPQEVSNILKWVARDGYTFQEVAEHIGTSKTKARLMYLEALAAARTALDYAEPVHPFIQALRDARDALCVDDNAKRDRSSL